MNLQMNLEPLGQGISSYIRPSDGKMLDVAAGNAVGLRSRGASGASFRPHASSVGSQAGSNMLSQQFPIPAHHLNRGLNNFYAQNPLDGNLSMFSPAPDPAILLPSAHSGEPSGYYPSAAFPALKSSHFSSKPGLASSVWTEEQDEMLVHLKQNKTPHQIISDHLFLTFGVTRNENTISKRYGKLVKESSNEELLSRVVARATPKIHVALEDELMKVGLNLGLGEPDKNDEDLEVLEVLGRASKTAKSNLQRTLLKYIQSLMMEAAFTEDQSFFMFLYSSESQ
ncbi:hypothetical protein B0T19DRAFT_479688 [Cercophora scortea]|uniref:Uncharacterized protein n=1 Tax=Cercophora scortea TaxID=314031 RepID=A0AAE0I3U0_9PEZI|nr:hypothetical protein B0T19DRAFT_479688 [Cercophora scortea]